MGKDRLKAVVMAGGEGSRLRPITSGRPKPLVPVCNVPIMEHILGLLKRHGIEDVVATLHFLADEIQNAFGDGSEFGVNLNYSIEDTPLGTAGSVKQAEDQLKDGTFLIISGDALTDCDITKAIAFHREKKSKATLVLYRVPNPLEFGVVITDPDGKIVRFLEKPGWSEVFSDTVNTGMYILEPEVLARMEPGKSYDWSRDIFPELLREGEPIFGYVMEEYWADVGSLTQYREAQEHLLAGRVDLPIPGEETTPGVHVGLGCDISDQAVLVPPIAFGHNCKVKKGARIGPYTVIGDNAFIEEGASIERSVLWDSAYVGLNVAIHSAIVGSRVTIKRDTVLHEDSVVGDRCLLDVGCVVRPRVKLWPDKIIERGSTVTMSLVWGNRWRGNLFRSLGVAGLSNIEITPDFACRLGAAYGSCLPPKSKVVTSRDSTRSSRMIKRAIIAALVSAGCDVLDLRSTAVPIARYYIRSTGAAGGVNVRKLPGNARVTLIEMFDGRGAYIPKNLERKIETAFFREDFNRTDPDDLGVIGEALRAVEGYQSQFFNLLGEFPRTRKLKVACDYGYSALGAFYPAMLGKLGIESISLNGYHDTKLSPRTGPEIESHIANLQKIVGTLDYELGVLFTEEGERMSIVDDRGRLLESNALFASLCTLVARTQTGASVGMSVTAPSRLQSMLEKEGVTVLRTKADTPSLMHSSLDAGVSFAGDDRGGFIFPEFHPGFDAQFTFAKLLAMLQQTGLKLSEIADALPSFELAYEQVKCPWETKGAVMRRISEESKSQGRVELLDGIKIYDHDHWVLVLPDAVEPVFHVYAESPQRKESEGLVSEYAKRIEAMAGEGG